MKRPVVLIISVAAGAFLVAGAGASAHTAVLHLATRAGTQSGVLGEEASWAHTESTEPTESPEATPTAEPTEKPEATPAQKPATTETDNDTETNDENDNETNDQNDNENAAQSSSGEHDGGGDGGGD